MTGTTATATRAAELGGRLVEHGYAPMFGTPCGVLAPLYAVLERHGLITVPREDNAVGAAAGAALAGRYPVVLMQNSGLGQSVNALASLVVPYRIPLALVISLRGTGFDDTAENAAMGRLTEDILDGLGVPARHLDAAEPPGDPVDWLDGVVKRDRRAAALLIGPGGFGWKP